MQMGKWTQFQIRYFFQRWKSLYRYYITLIEAKLFEITYKISIQILKSFKMKINIKRVNANKNFMKIYIYNFSRMLHMNYKLNAHIGKKKLYQYCLSLIAIFPTPWLTHGRAFLSYSNPNKQICWSLYSENTISMQKLTLFVITCWM